MYSIKCIDEREGFLREQAENLLSEVLWAPLGISVESRDIFYSRKADEHFYLAVDDDKNVLACLVFAVEEQSMEIRHIAVQEGFQKLGIGMALVEAVRRDWQGSMVKVIARNTSLGFWEALGFAEEGNWLDHPSFAPHSIRFMVCSARAEKGGWKNEV